MANEKKEEGARGFAVLLQEVEDGELHTDLSTQVQALVKSLTEHAYFYNAAAKGKIALTLNLKCDERGVVEITSEVKTTEPKRRRAKSTFWATDGNNLSPNNPKQTKLPLREVPRGASAEVPADGRQTRSV
jgi:hypothetical protein